MSAPALSPCIRVCVLDDASRVCLGCYRTVEEVAAWTTLDDAARRATMADLPSRAGRLSTAAAG